MCTWDLLDDGCDFPPFDFIISTSAWLAQNSKVVSLICHVTSSSLVCSSTDFTQRGRVWWKEFRKVRKRARREIKKVVELEFNGIHASDHNSVVLCCTVLCWTEMYCTVLHCTALYQHYTVLYCHVHHCSVPCRTVPCSIVLVQY